MTERIEYVITHGGCVGNSVNYPIVVQGDSLEEMKVKMKKVFKLMIADLQKLVDEESFEYKEVSTFITEKTAP
jgi:hypothetical protein